jgi:short subunit dehydrogenase-like uncharacterized protein
LSLSYPRGSWTRRQVSEARQADQPAVTMSTAADTTIYDVVLYGVGFTGRLTALYLARRAASLPRTFTWALAARSRDKLEALRAELAATCGPSFASLPLIVAAADAAGAATVASRARCVLAAAGPFVLCGEPLIAACASRGVHYADATGETHWVADMIARHGAAARTSRAIIVPFSGFDSVPSDLGALHCVAAARRAGTQLASITAVARMRGALSGGTVATAAAMSADPRARAAAADPLLLVPGASRAVRAALAAPLPDGELPSREPALGAAAFTQPHLMAAINTRVVRQSAALFAAHSAALARAASAEPALAAALPAPSAGGYAYAPGGTPFAYRERALARSWLGALLATLFGRIVSFALLPPFAPLVRRFLPAPGAGPSDVAMARNSFKLYFVGTRAAEAAGAPVVTCVSGPDAYLATAVSLAETGVLLAEASRGGAAALDRLPAAAFGYGFLTPATSLGMLLVERLRGAGMRFDELSAAEAAAVTEAPRGGRRSE